jgi:hypothetical protein
VNVSRFGWVKPATFNVYRPKKAITVDSVVAFCCLLGQFRLSEIALSAHRRPARRRRSAGGYATRDEP